MNKRNQLISLLNKAAKSKTLLDLSPGDQIIDLVYIDDVYGAFQLSLSEIQKINSGEIENYSVINNK
ncbi:hypothetical protein [Candidatus Williamhamiltonella defendens]|uniref:hypothetical protein n=1 Tax=Candidatus Williamhamiltonella defendens TaxID=138072 RepID=UPI00130E1E95|nr:hypothetical protein [Candidatus Hamiltonella defensa]